MRVMASMTWRTSSLASRYARYSTFAKFSAAKRATRSSPEHGSMFWFAVVDTGLSLRGSAGRGERLFKLPPFVKPFDDEGPSRTENLDTGGREVLPFLLQKRQNPDHGEGCFHALVPEVEDDAEVFKVRDWVIDP